MSDFGQPPGGGGFGQPPGGGGGFGQPPGGGGFGQPPGGGGFGQQPGGGGYGPPPGGGYGAPPPQSGGFGPTGGGAPKTETMAIVSLVCGLAGVLSCCCCFLLPLPVAAIATGVIAMNKIKGDPSLKGKELALAGAILGGICLLLTIASIIFNLVTGGMDALTNPSWNQYG